MTLKSEVSHPVRGTFLAIIFGLPMIFCAVNAIYALARQFIAGWVPSQWFSNNAFDWLMAMGNRGGASDYIAFMVNSLLAYGCWWIIRWGYTGNTD